MTVLNVKRAVTAWAFCALFAAGVAPAADGEAILKQQCSQCHAMQAEDDPATLQQMWELKGPNLSYAGIKYKPEWLQAWLQKPQRLRPAGMFFANHTKPGKEHDAVDDKTLSDHPVLAAAEAEAVTAALMSKKAKADLIVKGAYKDGSISLSMGEMLFDKFRGCLACHRVEPGYGGVSGPEVYTAAKRLQEDYIISYINNPQAWFAKSIMPSRKMKESDLQKFVHYFRGLANEKFE